MIKEPTTNTYRTTARIVGAIYLAGFVVGIVGNILIQSVLGKSGNLVKIPAHSMLLAIGAMLWLLAVAGDAAHGVLMFPILKRHNERIAVGYLGFRIIDAVFIAVMVLFVLVQIPLGREYLKAGAADAPYLQALSTVLIQANQYAYDIGMIATGLAGVLLCATPKRASPAAPGRLGPRRVRDPLLRHGARRRASGRRLASSIAGGCGTLLHRTSSAKPSVQSGWIVAKRINRSRCFFFAHTRDQGW